MAPKQIGAALTQKDRVEFAHMALMLAIDNMAKYPQDRVFAVSVVSRKREYDREVDILKRVGPDVSCEIEKRQLLKQTSRSRHANGLVHHRTQRVIAAEGALAEVINAEG